MAKTVLTKRNKPKEIKNLLKHEKRDKMLITKLKRYHPYDIATTWNRLTDNDIVRLRSFSDAKRFARVIAMLPPEEAHAYLSELNYDERVEILDMMPTHRAIETLRGMPESEAFETVAAFDGRMRDVLRRVLRLKRSQIGSAMHIRPVTVLKGETIKTARTMLGEAAAYADTTELVFVINQKRQLEGVIPLKTLLSAKPSDLVETVMDAKPQHVTLSDDVQDVVALMRHYDIFATAVVDENNKLLGVVTVETVLDIIHQNMHEDYAKGAEMPMHYNINNPSNKQVRVRLAKLLMLIGVNIALIAIMLIFASTYKAVLPVIVFLPLVGAMASHATNQTLATTVIMLESEAMLNIETKRSHIAGEVMSGFVNGVLLGGLTMLASIGLHEIFPAWQSDMAYAWVLGGAVFAGIMIATLLAMGIPLIINRLSGDPAASGSPVIATAATLIAIAIYFTLTAVLLIPIQ